MSEQEIIDKIAGIVEQQFKNESSGHDWWHIYRVWKTSILINQSEKANSFIVELAALLHDVADWKFNNGDDKAGGIEARKILQKYPIDDKTVDAVVGIVDAVSYKGAGVKNQMESMEGKIVQDADRLDAIGAIGIARTFAYGGNKNRSLYDPEIKPENHSSFEAYKNSKSHTINHFYEKLLLLKDRMNTETGKKIAIERHLFMEQFLDQFYREWNGEENQTKSD